MRILSHQTTFCDKTANALLGKLSESYELIRCGFLAMMSSKEVHGATITSSKIKQVYFPVSSSYHQLSLLTNASVLFDLKKRIDRLRFSDEAKSVRELKKSNVFSEQEFSEIYDVTTIGYGGTKPQNISSLNNKNYGTAHLLLSLPPILSQRKIHFPKHNFFLESLRYNEYRDHFYGLHRLFKTDYNNIKIREGRDYRLHDIIDRLIDTMWAVRAESAEQYQPENSRLKAYQKIWLCHEYEQKREEETWLKTLCHEISIWIIRSYEKILNKYAYKLGEAERLYIYDIVHNSREAFR